MRDEERYVLSGPPLTVPTIEVSSGKFLYERLLKTISNGTALISEKTNESITYRELFEVTRQLAVSMRNYGFSKKDIVGICSENSIYYLIPVFAGIFEGIPVVPINPSYTDYEIIHAFNLVLPNIIFCSKDNARRIYHLKAKFTCIKEVVELGSKQNDSDIPNLYNFISKWYSNIQNYAPIDVRIDDHIALIMFSSGTTGLPKGVMLTHRNFNTRKAITLEPNYFYEPKTRVTLGVLPFFHLFGLNTVITGLVHGRMVVVIEKFDPIIYLSCVEKYKIETITAAPAIVQLLAKSPLVDKFDLSHVKDLLVGSAPLSQTLEKAVKKRLPIKYVRQGYSMTEGSATFVTVPPNTERLGSCGKLYPTVKGVVKDIETEENLGPLKTGELCFKGNIIMKGYYKNEAETRAAFTKDGYLKTGDIGYYDDDGYFYVIDRIKELIKYKGYQVAPAELEAILIAHPKVKDVAVVGIPDVEAGELPMALVVLQPNAGLTEDDVMMYLNKYVSRHKRLRGGVKFVVEIPRNSLGKINRKEVKVLATRIIKSKL
ncbi:hypothetical protein Trydic_g14886 [Trypoxylus dichotomus]